MAVDADSDGDASVGVERCEAQFSLVLLSVLVGVVDFYTTLYESIAEEDFIEIVDGGAHSGEGWEVKDG